MFESKIEMALICIWASLSTEELKSKILESVLMKGYKSLSILLMLQ